MGMSARHSARAALMLLIILFAGFLHAQTRPGRTVPNTGPGGVRGNPKGPESKADLTGSGLNSGTSPNLQGTTLDQTGQLDAQTGDTGDQQVDPAEVNRQIFADKMWTYVIKQQIPTLPIYKKMRNLRNR